MSLTVRSLNGDTTFLLTFAPPDAPASPSGIAPGTFTVLTDPWLVGPITFMSTLFAFSERRASPCISSLKELDQAPDVVLVSLTQPDHCNEKTLRQLPPESRSTILAIPPAARKIRSWKHFQPERIQVIPKYSKGGAKAVHRIVIPALSPHGTCGEVTFTWLPAKLDLTGLHDAIGITYRPPSNEPSPASIQHANLQTHKVSSQVTEKTLSLIYSPHGPQYDVIQNYASSHFANEAGLRLTALLHSLDTVTSPWYFGGIVSAGGPGGLKLARSLNARAWVGAHDADKNNSGISVSQSRIEKHTAKEVKQMLNEGGDKENEGMAVNTEVVSLGPGEVYSIRVA